MESHMVDLLIISQPNPIIIVFAKQDRRFGEIQNQLKKKKSAFIPHLAKNNMDIGISKNALTYLGSPKSFYHA